MSDKNLCKNCLYFAPSDTGLGEVLPVGHGNYGRCNIKRGNEFKPKLDTYMVQCDYHHDKNAHKEKWELLQERACEFLVCTMQASKKSFLLKSYPTFQQSHTLDPYSSSCRVELQYFDTQLESLIEVSYKVYGLKAIDNFQNFMESE